MSGQAELLWMSLLFYTFLVLIPMIPAAFFHKFFPKDKISATGVLSNFQINTTGAFASYVIVVILAFSQIKLIQQVLSVEPVWTITAQVEAHDMAGKVVSLNSGWAKDKLIVSLRPDLQQRLGDQFQIKVPGDRSTWKTRLISFELPNFGQTAIKMSDLQSLATVDEATKTVEVASPIVVVQTEPYKPAEAAVLKPSTLLQPPASAGREAYE